MRPTVFCQEDLLVIHVPQSREIEKYMQYLEPCSLAPMRLFQRPEIVHTRPHLMTLRRKI